MLNEIADGIHLELRARRLLINTVLILLSYVIVLDNNDIPKLFALNRAHRWHNSDR